MNSFFLSKTSLTICGLALLFYSCQNNPSFKRENLYSLEREDLVIAASKQQELDNIQWNKDYFDYKNFYSLEDDTLFWYSSSKNISKIQLKKTNFSLPFKEIRDIKFAKLSPQLSSKRQQLLLISKNENRYKFNTVDILLAKKTTSNFSSTTIDAEFYNQISTDAKPKFIDAKYVAVGHWNVNISHKGVLVITPNKATFYPFQENLNELKTNAYSHSSIFLSESSSYSYVTYFHPTPSGSSEIIVYKWQYPDKLSEKSLFIQKERWFYGIPDEDQIVMVKHFDDKKFSMLYFYNRRNNKLNFQKKFDYNKYNFPYDFALNKNQITGFLVNSNTIQFYKWE